MRASSFLLGCWLLASRAADAAEAPGLLLETGSPDAFCPDLRQTREVVSRRLGSLEVAGRRGWRARYTIGHAPESRPRDFVRLELFNPEGVIELSRDLPMRGESCSTMAEVIALVLDRHFRSLVSEEHAVPNAPSNLQPDVQPAEPPPTLPESSVAHPQAESSPETSRLPRPVSPASRDLEETGSTGGSELPKDPTLSRRPLLLMAEFAETIEGRRQAIGVRSVFGIGSNLHLGSVVSFDVTQETEALPRGGTVKASSSGVRGFAAWGRPFGPLIAYIGPGVAVRLQRGQAEGLPQNRRLLRALWAGSLEAGLAILVERRFFVHATSALELTFRPLSGSFHVDEREVLRPATVQLLVGLGAGYAFYP